MTYRLAVFDLDGTLVGPGRQVQPSAAAAIASLPGRGIRVAPSATRPFVFARNEFREMGLSVPAIAGAGTDVRNDDGSVIRQVTMEGDCARFVSGLFDAHSRRGLIATPQRVYTTHEHAGTYPPPSLRVVNSMGEKPIANILIAIMEVRAGDALLRQLGDWAGPIRYEVVPTTEGLDIVVVTHAEACRESGMQALCDAEGISLAETVVFADGVEDIPMMQAAGYSVAMGDAPAAVREQASMVTGRRDEDGLAHAVKCIWG